jgi:putative serine protease PepD
MSENDFRPGHAGEHQPPQHSYPYYGQQPAPATQVLAPPPRKKGRRVAVMVSATAVAAALVGGAGGAAIVGLEGNSSPSAASTATPAQTVSGATNTDVSAVAAKVLPSVVQVNVTTDQGETIGSGVILSSDGKILTNAHVIDGASGTATVTLSDGTKYQASVLGSDTKADIAVLQAKGASGLTAATLGDSSQLKVGEQVVAIGSPGGLQNTVTSGIVSALNRQLSDIGTGGDQSSPFGQTANQTSGTPSYTAIQTDAAINQGNSGGALVNMAGQVIGINSALYSPSDSSAGSVGIGFAIPINDAKTIVSQIEND